jgi:hypothetical protein
VGNRMRENRIRASDEEYLLLKEYRDKNYPSTPLGSVIKILIENDD